MRSSSLRQILVLLEKYEKYNKALPVTAIRQGRLVSNLTELLKSTETETIKHTLSVLIQISYISPNEFTQPIVSKVLSLCHLNKDSNSLQLIRL